MVSRHWIKNWVKKKIEFYQEYLKNNENTPLKSEIENNIKTLKELI
jgi:hypothetical protein